MAKGVEDCAFYRTSRLTSLTEVGGDPSEWSVTVDEFHAAMAERQRDVAARDDDDVDPRHQARRGRAGADRRARRGPRPLGRRPGQPAHARTAARPVVRQPALAGGRSAPGRPRASASTPTPRRRCARPATGRRGPTPDASYESAVHAAVDAAFDDPAVRRSSTTVLARRSRGPGCEQRPVHQARRADDAGRARRLPGQRAVGAVAGRPGQPPAGRPRRTPRGAGPGARRRAPGAHPAPRRPGHAKLLVTQAALTLRRNQPHRFTTYSPVRARGARPADHVLAFDRGGALTVATRLPVGLAAPRLGRHRAARCPTGVWADLLTGREHAGDAPPGRPARRLPGRAAASGRRQPDERWTDDHGPFAVWAPVAEAAPPVGGRCHRGDDDVGTATGGSPSAPVPDPAEGELDYGYLIDDSDVPRPDPRSRRQPAGVHQRSRTYDPTVVRLDGPPWTGRQLAGLGHLRAARRHVHARGHARLRDRASSTTCARSASTWSS